MPYNIPSYGMMVADQINRNGLYKCLQICSVRIFKTVFKKVTYLKEMILSSKRDMFPLKIKFVDKDDQIIDYILFKTRNEKLILQKPFSGTEREYERQ
jgi:hypothetical protein